jgi:hypothetical protein
MCLVVTIHFPETTPAIVEQDFLDGSTLFVLGHRAAYPEKKVTTYNISDIQVGGCACGLLGHGESWETDTWELKAGMLPLLMATIDRVAKHFSNGFSFEASWNGKKPSRAQTVTLAELKKIIRENQVSTNMRYDVAA